MKNKMMHILLYQGKGGASLRKKAFWLAGLFFAVMIVLTYLSRAASSLTMAQVKTETPGERVIEHKVEAPGKAVQNREIAVNIEPGIRIQSVCVKEGSRVEKGDVLLELDTGHLDEMILQKQKEIRELELSNESLGSVRAADQKNQKISESRALEDYKNAKKDGDAEVKRAKKEWEEAQKELNIYKRRWGRSFGHISFAGSIVKKERVFEEMIQPKESRKENPEARPQNLSDEETGNSAQSPADEKEASGGSIQNTENEKGVPEGSAQNTTSGQGALGESTQSATNSDSVREQLYQLEAAVREKRAAYETALKARRDSLILAKRAIEDARQAKGEDKTDEMNDLKIDTLRLELSKLTDLKKGKGQVASPVKGVITGLTAVTGSKTGEDAAFLLADLSSGIRFMAQVPKEQERYVSPGAEASLILSGKQENLEDLSVEAVTANKEDPELLDVSILLKNGELSIGQTATMQIVQKSKLYPSTISLAAVHEDTAQKYVLVMRKKDTVLGEEWFAERVEISVKEENELYAAFEGGNFDEDQQIILSSNKPIKNGDRVRLAEQ